MHSTQNAGALSSDSIRIPSPLRGMLVRLASATYPAFLPHPTVAQSPYVRGFLLDLWKDAPKSVALIHTAMATVLYLLPLFYVPGIRTLGRLDAKSRDHFIKTLLHSKIYLFRMMAYAFRGNAFVAAFRDPLVRAALVTKPLYNTPAVKPARKSVRSAEKAPASADYVVIGSGAGGATVALALAEAGKDVVVLEEGGWFETKDFTEDLYGAMKNLLRGFGSQAVKGRSLFPVMQGACVGGSTVMNGAISHRLPDSVYEEWSADEAFARALPYLTLQNHFEVLERELGIKRNLEDWVGKLPVTRALDQLGWRYQAMARNAPGCEGTGRCLQGCPSGGKLSMEASFIPRAVEHGAKICANHRATRIVFEGKRAVGVQGDNFYIKANKGVIVCAGAIHTPRLLRRSGYAHPRLGENLQFHLGAGVLALMESTTRSQEGPPQGWEILEFDQDEIKLATQLLPPEVLLARTPFVGDDLLRMWKVADRVSSWTASVRSQSRGRVSGAIEFSAASEDLRRLRTGIRKLGELAFAMGAKTFYPGITGVAGEISSPADLALIDQAPLEPRNYYVGVGHLFGTCRMASDERHGVVDTNFRPYGTENLTIADASIFPSAIGVNPQLVIMALAREAASRVL